MTTIKAGDTVKIGGDASEKYSGRRAHVLKLLPGGTLAECRVPGVQMRPGDAYPAFPIEWLEPAPAVEPLVIETPTIVIMAVAQLQQERDELAAKLAATEAKLEALRLAMCDKHKHTDECLKYASETRKPYCIAPCAESRSVLTSLAPVDP